MKQFFSLFLVVLAVVGLLPTVQAQSPCQQYGLLTPGACPTMTISCTSPPVIGNPNFGVQIQGARTGSSAFFFLTLAPQIPPFQCGPPACTGGGCPISSNVNLATFVNGSVAGTGPLGPTCTGSASWRGFSIPNNPSLCGAQVFFQALVLDSAGCGPLSLLFAGTQGLRVTIQCCPGQTFACASPPTQELLHWEMNQLTPNGLVPPECGTSDYLRPYSAPLVTQGCDTFMQFVPTSTQVTPTGTYALGNDSAGNCLPFTGLGGGSQVTVRIKFRWSGVYPPCTGTAEVQSLLRDAVNFAASERFAVGIAPAAVPACANFPANSLAVKWWAAAGVSCTWVGPLATGVWYEATIQFDGLANFVLVQVVNLSGGPSPSPSQVPAGGSLVAGQNFPLELGDFGLCHHCGACQLPSCRGFNGDIDAIQITSP